MARKVIEVPDPVEEVPQLTERQLQIAVLVDDGMTFEEIGKELSISPRTVKEHCSLIKVKVGGVKKSRQIPRRLRELGIL